MAVEQSVSIDRDLCLGSGMCILYASRAFAHDDETKAVVTDPTGETIDALRMAADACPTNAISVTEVTVND